MDARLAERRRSGPDLHPRPGGDPRGSERGVFSTTRVTLIILSLPAKANILVDQTGHARLADFGLLTIISDPKYLLSSSSHTQGGTVRWMSPERIAPEQFGFKNSRPTISSDCYALGMVIYETIGGNIPFHKDTDLTVFMKVVVKGEHPPRGAKFATSLWEMLERCWTPKPSDRPSTEDVLRCLEMVSNLAEPTSPRTGGGTDEDEDSATNSSGGDSVDFFATDDRVQHLPIHPLQDHRPTNPPSGPAQSDHGQQIMVDSMCDTPDRILDSLPAPHDDDDLAGHRSIPIFPPPTPRAVTQRSSLEETTRSSTFSSICSEFLTMLDDGTDSAMGITALSKVAQIILEIFGVQIRKHYSVFPLAH